MYLWTFFAGESRPDSHDLGAAEDRRERAVPGLEPDLDGWRAINRMN
jgi:hypothetical protein